MQEERLEQLRKIFIKAVKGILDDVHENLMNFKITDNVNNYTDSIADKLVYEVKIRINNKGGE